MILCLDCGNTRIKAAIGEPGAWHAHAAVDQANLAALRQQLEAWPRPRRAVGCNVAGAAVGSAVEAMLAESAIAIEWLLASREAHGVRNSYDRPQQLGADRWAALIGARALHGGACLVVNCGTATTVDVLDATGTFLGGLILPGLAVMRSSLAQATAQLPLAAGRHAALPRNTDDAIVSGSIEATAGAVERMFTHVAPDPGALCLIAGGAAAELEPHLHIPVRRIDHLVLEGLARVATA